MISIFADKTSIILRKMLREQGKTWVIRDFLKESDHEFGLGQGRIALVLNEMERLGYIERDKSGAKSKAILTQPEALIEDWVKHYKFEYNKLFTFYSPRKNALKAIREYFVNQKKAQYALTLHTAANLLTSFVKTEDVYIYISSDNIKEVILDIRQQLDFKQLVQGGNIHIVQPFYKKSIFYNSQIIKGFRSISNLQLYLDLFNFQPRGREHAQVLREYLENKGKRLA